jgi:poly(A) polymerase
MPPVENSLTGRQVLDAVPLWLQSHLTALWRELGGELYLAGGVVRDLLLGITPVDIDLTVPCGAKIWAEKLADVTGGAYVVLGRDEDAARVVSRKTTVDFSSFRKGAVTILDELMLRDLTVNALGVRIDPLLASPDTAGGDKVSILDPTGGQEDLRTRRIQVTTSDSFSHDPLRLLRVFRFAAVLGFIIDATTLDQVRRQRHLIAGPAPERIAHELDLIMASPRAYDALAAMAKTGLLWEIIPELAAGDGLAQPASHHLDVWQHNLETLRQMERIVSTPALFFSNCGEMMMAYLDKPRRQLRLKWAALLHDLGKPATFAVRAEKGDRITFYNHDRVGADMFRAFARRLRWSNNDIEHVARLISDHMRPFHLANVARCADLTLRASVRMIRKAGDELEGLFFLSMADTLAGQGVECIEGMEGELVNLYRHLHQIRSDHVNPVRDAAPLLTGRDLIETLHLPPGPIFKVILRAVEDAQMEGTVSDYDGALQLAKEVLTGDPVVTCKEKG